MMDTVGLRLYPFLQCLAVKKREAHNRAPPNPFLFTFHGMSIESSHLAAYFAFIQR